MSFHEVRFPPAISIGSTGGPERKTDIVTLNNGYEERNSVWSHSRRKYDAGIGMASLDDLFAVTSFFEARMGRLYGFRWKDWADYKSCVPSASVSATDQILGEGDSVETDFALRKAYSSGGETYWRPIVKVVENRIFVAVDGDLQSEGSDYYVNIRTGLVSFAVPPAEGSVVTAGFEFDVPVRFELDGIETSVTSFSAGQIPNVPVIEVRV